MGAGGRSPRGPTAGRREARSVRRRLRLVARRAPLSRSRRLRGRDRGWRSPRSPRPCWGQRVGRRRRGVFGGAFRIGAAAGKPGGGGPQIEGEILPAPEGVLRIFCRQRQAHCLCLTRLRHLLRGGGGAAKHPRTPRAAPHPPLGRRPAPAPRSPRRRRCAPRPRPAPRPGRRGRVGVEGFMAQSRTLIVGPGPAWFRLP